MAKDNVIDLKKPEPFIDDPITDILCSGARQLLAQALEFEVASFLIDQGENIKYIQNQMGHASIKVTLDTYGHLMKDVNKEAASRLGNAIFEQDGSKMVANKQKGVTV